MPYKFNPFTGNFDQVLGTDPLEVGAIQFDTDHTPLPEAEGLMQWNTDDGTLDVGLPNGVTGQMFQEMFFDAKNATANDIQDGVPVMFAAPVGASGKVEIQLAIADGTIPSEYIMGLTTEPIAKGEWGKVTWFGKVRGINTTGSDQGETWSDGSLLYVSDAIAGGLTNIPPEAPAQRILVASVVVAHSNGTIQVRPTWNPKLMDLDDVDGTTPLTGYVLGYNETTGVWDPTNFLDTDFEFGGSLTSGGSTTGQSSIARGIVINESGGNTAEDSFRTETGNSEDAFRVDADTDEVKVGVSFSLPYGAKTAAYTVTALDHTIDCTANSFTVTLPTAVGVSGRMYSIKNTGTGAITVDPNGTETIDGQLTAILSQWDCLKIQSTGTNWIII